MRNANYKMSKKITINENQFSDIILKEAMNGQFNKAAFDAMPSFVQKVKYCKTLFGEPIGNGSSRMVFQIDDYRVFKLAKNPKGIAQNEQELNILNDYYLDGLCIFPTVYEDSDTENFTYVISDYVLPAKSSDFKRVLGLTFNQVALVIRTMDPYNRFEWAKDRKLLDYAYEKDEEFWGDVNDYIVGYDIPTGDLCSIRNWGFSPKYGGSMVLLDYGLNDDIYDKFYKRR